MLRFKNIKIKKQLISKVEFDDNCNITIEYNENDNFKFIKCYESDFNFIIKQLDNEFVRLQNVLYNKNMIETAEYIKKFGLYNNEPTMRGKIYLKFNRFSKIENIEIIYGYLGDCEKEFERI